MIRQNDPTTIHLILLRRMLMYVFGLSVLRLRLKIVEKNFQAMQRLDADALSHIFSILDTEDLANINVTCKLFNEYTNTRMKDLKHFTQHRWAKMSPISLSANVEETFGFRSLLLDPVPDDETRRAKRIKELVFGTWPDNVVSRIHLIPTRDTDGKGRYRVHATHTKA